MALELAERPHRARVAARTRRALHAWKDASRSRFRAWAARRGLDVSAGQAGIVASGLGVVVELDDEPTYAVVRASRGGRARRHDFTVLTELTEATLDDAARPLLDEARTHDDRLYR